MSLVTPHIGLATIQYIVMITEYGQVMSVEWGHVISVSISDRSDNPPKMTLSNCSCPADVLLAEIFGSIFSLLLFVLSSGQVCCGQTLSP